MKALILIFLSAIMCLETTAQDNLPYHEIPDYPEVYNAETVAARMIDGLGFRFYWATEGLRPEDLEFRPNEEARTTAETIDHIYGLTNVIANATDNKPNERTDEPALSFEEKRAKTLENLKRASDILKSGKSGLADYKVVFRRGESSSEYPYWNLINGPIADALWHCGQVVSLRRSSGNPFNSKVSVFNGKLRE